MMTPTTRIRGWADNGERGVGKSGLKGKGDNTKAGGGGDSGAPTRTISESPSERREVKVSSNSWGGRYVFAAGLKEYYPSAMR